MTHCLLSDELLVEQQSHVFCGATGAPSVAGLLGGQSELHCVDSHVPY
jgi:hypothetical protein